MNEDELADAQPHRRGMRRKSRTRGVDLNNADEEELDALWGVGPISARRIVEYGQREGRIRSVDHLVNIDGIKGAMVEIIRNDVRV